MKRLTRLVTLAALAMMSAGASAQENVAKAIGAFAADIEKNCIKSATVMDGKTKAYSKIYEFSLPKKQAKNIEPLKSALYRDMPAAYNVFVKNADDTSKSSYIVAYGDDLQYTLHLGWPYCKSGRNYIFMCVADKTDSLYRYVYGMEWQKVGKKTEGKVYELYSKNPKKVKKTSIDDAEFDELRAELDELSDELDKLDFQDNGKYTEIKDLKDLKKLKSLGSLVKMFGGTIKDGDDSIEQQGGNTVLRSGKQMLVVGADGSIKMDDGKGGTMVIDSDGKITSTSIGTSGNDSAADIAPIQQFGNLRAAYLSNVRDGNIDNVTRLTGLANSILDLCRQKGQQMSSDEKRLCIDGLKEMQEQTPDKFIKGIFGVAIRELDK